MDSILTKRLIDHDEAQEAVQRLVNSHFNNDRDKHPHARMSIPANPDRDDDLVMSAYIKQRRQTSDDLQRVLDAVLFVFGPEALLKIDQHVRAARKAQETNDEIDALEKALVPRDGSDWDHRGDSTPLTYFAPTR